MQTRFLHMADCHLGYRQYNLRERFNDFGYAFIDVIDTAIAEQVDFVLLAGDLFQKRSIDALTLNQAMRGLERLRAANIPCIAVEGNHEHAYYDEYIGWMKFLALRDLIILLDPPAFKEGKPQLQAYSRRDGSYIDPKPGVRVHGLRYQGASAARALAGYAEALAELPRDGVEYAIFLTHAGMEGVLPEEVGGLSARQLAPLRPHVDYLALGHIHKPFERDGWVYNPGSLETCSITEAAWPERGYYLVDVDTRRGDGMKHTAVLRANRRRRFYHLTFKVDLHNSPDALYANCEAYLARRARDHGVARLGPNDRPVVVLHLSGVLPFDRSALAIGRLEEMVRECYNPLHVIVRNATQGNELQVESGGAVSRPVLERQVLADLFSRDARFRPHSGRWANLALGLKALALEGAAPEAVVEELESQMAQIEQAEEPAPQVNSHADPVG
ncbi:MAG TPA: exonuclease SbcCD subunit D [Caldilineaceae bacterium]|nr:exonuclease SbcCD subunit D [Caldilineaceae bacterium]